VLPATRQRPDTPSTPLSRGKWWVRDIGLRDNPRIFSPRSRGPLQSRARYPGPSDVVDGCAIYRTSPELRYPISRYSAASAFGTENARVSWRRVAKPRNPLDRRRLVAMDGSTSEATRYLCAAAHLDPSFRMRALELERGSRHRAIAPSYGIDSRIVIANCVAAQRRARARYVLLTALLVWR
jgi:hypothetical protein